MAGRPPPARLYEERLNLDKINGRVVHYSPSSFPYLGGVSGYHQQLHYIIPASDMTSCFTILANYKPNDRRAKTRICLLTFLAEAVRNVVINRGSQAPNFFHHGSTDSRFVALLTYLPKKIYSNENAQVGLLSTEAMLDPTNLAGIMISIFLIDKEITFEDAISDMIEINARGQPLLSRFKKEKPAQAAKGGGRVGRPRARPDENDETSSQSDSQAEEDNDEEGEGGGGAAPAVVEDPNANRRDIPKKSLSAGRYYFSQTPQWISEQKAKSNDLHMYVTVNTLARYNDLLSLAVGIPPGNRKCASDAIRLSDPIMQGELCHPDVCLSLEKGIDMMTYKLGVSRYLRSANVWEHQETKEFATPKLIDRADNVLRQLPIMTLLSPSQFSSLPLLVDQLPHCRLMSEKIIHPRSQKEKVSCGYHADGVQHTFYEEDVFASLGLQIVSDKEAEDQARLEHPDIFNNRFSEYFSVMSDLETMRVRDTPGWIEKLQRFRLQSRDWMERQLNSTDRSRLPKGIAAIMNYFDTTLIHPFCDNMTYSKEAAMSPFCQWLAKDIRSYSKLLLAADGGLMLLREIFVVGNSAGLPKIGGSLNKLNLQIIGPPASSKTHTLQAAEKLFVKSTWTSVTGTSEMGLIRKDKSERQIDIYGELPPDLRPTADTGNGVNMRQRRMLLTEIGEGEFNYRTTGKVQDEWGRETLQNIETKVEFTNPIIGCANPEPSKIDPESSGAALLNRFESATLYVPLDSQRNKILYQIVECDLKPESAAGIRVQEAHAYRHALNVFYGIAIASYAVPLPDIRLFSDLSEIAFDYLSDIRPEISNYLRQMTRLKTKAMVEVINNATRLAACSPLSVRMNAQANQAAFDLGFDLSEDGSPDEAINMKNLSFMDLMEEISRYCYMTYDIMIFVLTRAAHELLGGNNLALLRGIAIQRCNYLPKTAKDTTGRRATTWPLPVSERDVEEETPEEALERYDEERLQGMVYASMPLKTFLEKIDKVGVYYLGMPMSLKQASYKKMKTGEDNSSLFYRYNLNTAGQRMARLSEFVPDAVPAPCVDRPTRPNYKIEYTESGEYYNPNYLLVTSSINQLKDTINGKVGSLIMTPSQILSMLNEMSGQFMNVRYIPCIPKGDTLMTDAYGLIQSLRYSKAAMNAFPLCRVPVIIQNYLANETYILAAAVEMDIYRICDDMVQAMTYCATPRRTVLFGFPSEKDFGLYQTYKLEPVEGELFLRRRSGAITEEDRTILQDYADFLISDNDQDRQFGRGEDLEEIHAWNYLKASNPGKNEDDLRQYLPANIMDRLYGVHGFYTRHPELKLSRVPYGSVAAARPVEKRRSERVINPDATVAPNPAPAPAPPVPVAETRHFGHIASTPTQGRRAGHEAGLAELPAQRRRAEPSRVSLELIF